MPSGVMISLTANGTLPPAGPSEKTFAEIRELEKILKLRDEVIAGTHPRIKVPAHLIGKLGPRPLQSPALVSRPSTAETKARPSTISGQSHLDEPAHPLPKSPEPRQLTTSKSVVSEIDPVLLTKSEDLVRAEIQLHRQRLERVLKEQHDQRRTESRQRHPHQELVPEFDVSDVLEKALQIVHPVEGVRGGSSDHNSYYSSQQNDSPIEEVENSHEVQVGQEQSRPEGTQTEDMEIDDLHITEDAEKQRISPLQVALRDSDYWGGAQEAVAYVDELRRQPYTSISHGSNQIEHRGRHYYTAEPRDVYEEPNQVESAGGPQIGFQGNSDYIELEVRAEHHNRRDREASINHMDSAQAPAHATSHESPEITVVRNHISSPLAPRPERVSPLAVARVPPLVQEHQHEELNSQREPLPKRSLQAHSPESPSQPSIQRKRRQPFNETESRQIPASRLADSSPPQIKEEPLSPVPLSSVPIIRPMRLRPQIQRVSSLERQPSRDSTNRDSFAKPHEQPQRYRNDTDISASALPLRVSSRGSVRRLERDDHGLRRYVRYSRRPQSPTYSIQVSPTDSRPVRATTHAFANHLVVDQHRHYREPSRSQLGQYPTGVRSGRSRSPPPLRERYPSIQQEAVIMAPPSPLPPRIAMDKYGRGYIPTPTVIRHSAAPPNRQGEIGPYFERAATRDPVLRVPIPDDLYSDRTFVERLPPFPPPSRRIIEQSPIDTADYRAYRERDYAVSQGTIPVTREEYRDYPERRISQYEEIVIPEYIPRMQTARPDAGRYETARDFVSLKRCPAWLVLRCGVSHVRSRLEKWYA